jgi:hypothetical protein
VDSPQKTGCALGLVEHYEERGSQVIGCPFSLLVAGLNRIARYVDRSVNAVAAEEVSE